MPRMRDGQTNKRTKREDRDNHLGNGELQNFFENKNVINFSWKQKFEQISFKTEI